jgi:hypothetical protein
MFPIRHIMQDEMRDKFFTHTDRARVYAEGKRAFEEDRLRSFNPYAGSKEFAGLWWHGWGYGQRENQRRKIASK